MLLMIKASPWQQFPDLSNNSCTSDQDCADKFICCKSQGHLSPKSPQCIASSQCAIRYPSTIAAITHTQHKGSFSYGTGHVKPGQECSSSQECLDSSNICHKSTSDREANICMPYSQVHECKHDKSSGFITRCGNQLFENGLPYRWISMNVPNYLLLEDLSYGTVFRNLSVCRLPVAKPHFDENGYAFGVENSNPCIVPKPTDTVPRNSYLWIPPTPAEQEDAVLAIKGMGGRVIRTYTLGFGPVYHANIPSPSSPIEFYEPVWVAFDNAIAMARKHGIRLIVPLINHYWGNLDYMYYILLFLFLLYIF